MGRGLRVRERLSEALYEPPTDLLALDLDSLENLRGELEKLPAPERPVWSPVAPPSGRREAV